MKINKTVNQQDYEYMIWRLSRTLNKLGYNMSPTLKKGFSQYAYAYGANKTWTRKQSY